MSFPRKNGDRFIGNMGDEMILFEGTFYLFDPEKNYEKVGRSSTRSTDKSE
jgi:hypothetical protein